MSLQNVREKLRTVLKERDLTQDAFARKYALSSSWLNKFLREEMDNPQFRSLERLQAAIDAESKLLASNSKAA